MMHTHHSLKHALTKTILLWSTSFFVILGILFLLSFNTLEQFMLNLMANQQLDYQVQEYAEHLQLNNSKGIQQEKQRLLADPMVSAVMLIDASGKLLHASLSQHHPVKINIADHLDFHSIDKLIADRPHLHLFQRNIPNNPLILALVLDDRSVDAAIYSTTLWSGSLLLLFLLTSIKALHITLKRQLILPVDHINQAIENNNISSDTIQKLEDELPDEASNILEAYGKLKLSRNELRLQISDMMQTLSSCFWWSDNGHTYTGISEKSTDILHRSASDLQASNLWAWTNDNTQIHHNNTLLQHAIEQHEEKIDIAYQIEHDEESFWFGECITLCYNEQGQLNTLFGVITDISTRKKQQQEQAEQLELLHRMETTGTLVGGIAHEFNNALAGMNGNVFLIKQSSNDKQTLTRLARIESLIDRSAAMIDSMLSFARKGNLKTHSICLMDFLQKLQLAVLPSLTWGIKLDITSSDNNQQSIIPADPKKLQEVILHLIDNAKLAMIDTNKAIISIQVQHIEADDVLLKKYPRLSSRQLVHLSLHDNGCGINDNIKGRIFEPFFTTREVGQGTGLGLSMVFGYMNQMGGAVDVESNAESGTTFHLYFPHIVEAQVQSPPSTLLLGDGEKILVVDDDTLFRESTCDVLKKMEYKSIEARDGKEAVQVFEQHHDNIRLILMDIVMPNMNGIEATKEIRRISATVPIIYLTAYDCTDPVDPEVYEKHAELINKPFRISTLSQAIQKALHKTDKQVGLFIKPDNS